MLLRLWIGTVLVFFLSVSLAAAADGPEVFKNQCAKCHGDTGTSDTTVGKAMKVPPLAGDAELQKATEDEVVALIKDNEKHPPNVKALGAEDLKAAAGVVKGFAAK